MTTAAALLDDTPQAPTWFIEAKDSDPAAEITRQGLFLSRLRILAPAVNAIAIPNAGKRTKWEAWQRTREGMRKGALDLVLTWPGGVFFAEFKSGRDMPDANQRDMLNLLTRQGHRCGVYRTPDCLLRHLWEAGAPFLSREGRL